MTTDGRSFLTDAGLVLVMLGVVASAVANWFFSGLVFFGEQLTRDDHRSMGLGFALAAAVLVLALAPAFALRARGWVFVVALVLAGGCAFLASASWHEMAAAPPDEYPEPWAALQVMAWCPTGWPLYLLILATPWLRGRSSPRPRSPQAH